MSRQVEIDNLAAHAVSDAEPSIVAAADDPVADAELAVPGCERLGAEPAGVEHEEVGSVIELPDLVAAVGEHDPPAWVRSAAFHQSSSSRCFAAVTSSSRWRRPCEAA